MRKYKRRVYTDGALQYGERVQELDARKRTIGHKFVPVGHSLRFEKMREREEDVEFANQQGKRIDFKLKCPDDRKISNDHAVVIDGQLYEVIKIDRMGGEVFLYLQTADMKG